MMKNFRLCRIYGKSFYLILVFIKSFLNLVWPLPYFFTECLNNNPCPWIFFSRNLCLCTQVSLETWSAPPSTLGIEPSVHFENFRVSVETLVSTNKSRDAETLENLSKPQIKGKKPQSCIVFRRRDHIHKNMVLNGIDVCYDAKLIAFFTERRNMARHI